MATLSRDRGRRLQSRRRQPERSTRAGGILGTGLRGSPSSFPWAGPRPWRGGPVGSDRTRSTPSWAGAVCQLMAPGRRGWCPRGCGNVSPPCERSGGSTAYACRACSIRCKAIVVVSSACRVRTSVARLYVPEAQMSSQRRGREGWLNLWVGGEEAVGQISRRRRRRRDCQADPNDRAQAGRSPRATVGPANERALLEPRASGRATANGERGRPTFRLTAGGRTGGP